MKQTIKKLSLYGIGFLLYIVASLPGRWSQDIQLVTIGVVCLCAAYVVSKQGVSVRKNMVASLYIIIPWLITVIVVLLEKSFETFLTWGVVVPASILSGIGLKMISHNQTGMGVWLAGGWICMLVLGYLFLPDWKLFYINQRDSFGTSFPDGVVFYDTENRPVAIDSLRGKVVLLDFWTYSCAVCVEGFPDLERLAEHYKGRQDVGVYAARLPVYNDSAYVKRGWQPDKKFSFASIHSQDQHAMKALDIRGVPMVVVLDKQGKCAYKGSANLSLDALFLNINNVIKKLL